MKTQFLSLTFEKFSYKVISLESPIKNPSALKNLSLGNYLINKSQFLGNKKLANKTAFKYKRLYYQHFFDWSPAAMHAAIRRGIDDTYFSQYSG